MAVALVSVAAMAFGLAHPPSAAPEAGAGAVNDTTGVAARLFEYDPGVPLDVTGTVIGERDGASIHDISYASPKGGRVTAYLIVPSGKGPFAGILFGHWGGGNRTEFLSEAILYARAGAVSLLVDYPWARPEPWRHRLQYFANPENDRDAYIQAVVDLRRGIDLLRSRDDVDPQRIAYVGHSYGAQWGAILSAVDRRMRTCILAGGIPDAAAIWREGDDPDIVEARKSVPAEVLDKYLSTLAPLDAVGYVPHAAPISLLFQFARLEQNFKEPAMQRYAGAASEPKTVLWYDAGHDLNDVQALVDRAAWLRRKIGIRPVRLPASE